MGYRDRVEDRGAGLSYLGPQGPLVEKERGAMGWFGAETRGGVGVILEIGDLGSIHRVDIWEGEEGVNKRRAPAEATQNPKVTGVRG